MAVKPISPNEAKSAKVIPDFVIEAFNEMITEKINSQGSAVVLLKDVKDRIRTKTEQDIDTSWLDVEDVYRAEGWKVRYERPTYGDNYFDSYYNFSK